jgi:hypothetical protein
LLELDPAEHKYSFDGQPVPGVSEILDAAGFKGFYPPGDYRLRGTRVHEASVFLDMGAEVKVGTGIKGYVEAYRKFKADFYDVKWEDVEKPVYHAGLCYAGTLDRFGWLGGRKLLLDIKTGTPAKRRLRLQTAAYAVAKDEPGCLRWGLELVKDGSYKIHNCGEESDIDVWIGIVKRFHWEGK